MADINFFEMLKYNKDGNLISNNGSVIAEETKKPVNECAWNDANVSSKIPRRFWNTTFEDHPCNLTAETKEFSLAENNDHVLIFMGIAGCGKTTLMTSAMHERVLNGKSAGTYLSMRTLPAVIRSTRSFKAAESEIDFYDRLSTTPFLCLDEVGTSEDTQLESNFLKTIIALRYDNCLPMIISTNLNWEFFKKLISNNENDPIFDRLKAIAIRKGITENSHRSN